MRMGKAIGHDLCSDEYRPLETIRGIRDVELIDVLKCDECGHSVLPGYSTDWNWLVESARTSLNNALKKAEVTIADPEKCMQVLFDMRKRGDFVDDHRFIQMLFELAEKIAERIPRASWPVTTPYQTVNADLK
jgi:hypothetical protein